MSELEPGRVVGDRFEILGELGAGGMATVYLARDRVRDERVALKVVHAHLAADAGVRERLRREVRAAARVRHPGALAAFELHELDGRLALTMPFHAGRTLAEAVAVGGPRPVEEARAMGVRLAEVLAEAHRAGVLHRDVSPRNVMLDDAGGAALADFGLARFTDAGTARSTQLLGTPGYVAPEALRGQRADARGDVYGLGAVLYLALTGEEPFAGRSPAEALQRQLAGEAPSPKARRLDVPDWLDALVTRMLDADPARRPEGAAEVADALARGVAPATAAASATMRLDAPDPARPTLPRGEFAVVVRDREDARPRRKALRAKLRNEAPDLDGVLWTAGHRTLGVVRQALGLPGEATTPEERLARAVAREAGMDGAAVPAAMLEPRFTLVDGVAEDVAERLVGVAREEGFDAKVVRSGRQDLPARLVQGAWIAYPALWLAFAALKAEDLLPDAAVFGFVFLTVVHAAVLTPLLERRYGRVDLSKRPLAFKAPVATPSAPAPAPPPSLTGRVEAELDALQRLLADTAGLPDLAREDLARTARALRAELAELVAEAGRVDDEIGRVAGLAVDVAPLRARLSRLDTLARAGEPVDEAERARLREAIEAGAAREGALDALHARRVAAQAHVVEIGAAAARARRELATAPSGELARALADALTKQAQAAARARVEVR
ncbi:MAG: protein kinase domain-containing protein [Myxococcota bacterium]